MTVGSEINLIQFRVRFLKPGYIFKLAKNEDFLDPMLVYGLPEGKDIEDICEKIPNESEGKPHEIRMLEDEGTEWFKLTHPIVHVEPLSFIGPGPNKTGIEYEIEALSVVDVFERYVEELVKLAIPERDCAENWSKDKPWWDQKCGHFLIDAVETVVSITTAWRYTTTEYGSYEGYEYDSDYDLLGVVNLFEIEKITDKSPEPYNPVVTDPDDENRLVNVRPESEQTG